MKKAISILAFLIWAAGGCRAQVPPNPTVFNCPVTTGSTYTSLNGPNGTSSLTYSDTPTPGEYCYIVQAVVSSTSQVSLPSNTIGPFNVTGLTGAKNVNLSWTPGTGGPAPTGYIVSRSLAVASTLAAPTLGTGTLAENGKLNKTDLSFSPNLTGELR